MPGNVFPLREDIIVALRFAEPARLQLLLPKTTAKALRLEPDLCIALGAN